MAHEVFICYASPDKAVAEAVCDALESKQIKCWIAPRNVLPGTEWAEAIVDAIDSSRVIVLVLSSHSNTSPQVRREVGRAAGNDIPIIPLRIDDILPSKALDYFVSSHHFLDAITTPLEKHLARLTDTVQQILARQGAPPEGLEAEAEEKAERGVEEVGKAKESQSKEEVGTMSDGTPEKPKDIVARYAARIMHDKVFFAPNIPEKKLANALKKYADIKGREQPLILVDDTLFGSANVGMLITNRRIYCRESMMEPRSLAIQEIQDITFKKGWTGKVFNINNTKFWLATQIGDKEVEELISLLKQMASSLRSRKKT